MFTYSWIRRGQKVLFSWPDRSPVAILHIDLWMSGHHTDRNGYMAHMNVMCDLIQCVVVVPVPDEYSATLASYFMQHIFLKFGLCHLVTLDNDIPLKGFIQTYAKLRSSCIILFELADSFRHFSASILKNLIEDRRTAHVERINNKRKSCYLKPWDIFMAKTAIQGNKKKEKFSKLCYVVRSSYQIFRNTGHGSYFVKKLH